MPVDSKPLFRPEAIRPHLSKFTLSEAVKAFKPRLAKWAALLASDEGLSLKETELLPNFIRDVFEDLLGYVGPPGSPYTLKREALVKVDGKFADAGFGRFGSGEDRFVAVLEGKGPRDPLDRPFKSRKRSAVEQSLQYAVQLRIDWYLVTNLREIRLFHKAHDTFTFESFTVEQLATDEAELKRFVFLLGADRLIPSTGGNHLDHLLTESKRIGRELTNEFYKVYRQLRESAFRGLREANPTHDPLKLLAATQKMLDRVLFIAFCEDRELLPREIIAKAYSHQDDFNPWSSPRKTDGKLRVIDTFKLLRATVAQS